MIRTTSNHISAELKTPPHSDDLEQGILGCMLIDPAKAMPYLMQQKCGADAFFFESHRKTAEVIWGMFSRGEVIDIISVGEALAKEQLFEALGGHDYLVKLVDLVPTPTHLAHYVEGVQDAHMRRKGIDRCYQILDKLYDRSGDSKAAAIIQASDFFDLNPRKVSVQSNLAVMRELEEEWVQMAKSDGRILKGIPTGLSELDKLISGWPPGLNILAGRPGAGKTTYEGVTTSTAARQGMPALRITFDMTHATLIARDIAREAGVSLAKLNSGNAGKSHRNMEAVGKAIEKIAGWPMYIADCESMDNDVDQIASYIRMMVSREGVRVVSIDYAQQIGAPGKFPYPDEQKELKYVSSTLKNLGLKLGIPIILLSQFNRDADKAKRPPRLSDLGGSDGLGRDADTAIFFYKNEAFDYASAGINEKKTRAVICEIAKQKNGGIGIIPLWLYGPYFRFIPAGKDWSDLKHLPKDDDDEDIIDLEDEGRWYSQKDFYPENEHDSQ